MNEQDDFSMAYFGPPELKKAYERQVEAPIGQPCVMCEEAIVHGDIGTIDLAARVIHQECSIRSVVGSLGHQQQRCSCFGGTEEDPPGMTRRQAAIAASDYFYASAPWGGKVQL